MRAARLAPPLLALLALALPVAASAQISLTLAATGQFEHNSNVFDLQSGFSVIGLSRNPRLDDNDYSYTGTAGLKAQWRRQTLFADASGGQVRYDFYSQLDHDTYKVDAGWNGELGRAFNGNFEVIRSHTMIPFLDVFQSTLSLSTEQREQGGLGLLFLPRWRIDVNGYTHTVTWPLPSAPNLAVEESEGDADLEFVGTAGLTSGVSAGYLDGHFTGSPIAEPSYHQWTANWVTNEMTGRSSLTSQIGYTDRTASRARSRLNTISAVTGTLNYTNQLSGKTSVGLTLARNVAVYITNSGSQIDNYATVTATWQMTYKIGLTGSLTWDYAQLPGQNNNPLGGDRLDHVQTATGALTYQATRWLQIRPYASYQRRSSNYLGGNFNQWIAGANLTIRWSSAPESSPAGAAPTGP